MSSMSNNNANIRHRTSSAKHVASGRGGSINNNNNLTIDPSGANNNDDSPKISGGSSNNNIRSKYNTNNNIHIGVWSRIVLIVGLFTILTIMMKEIQEKSRVQHHDDAVPILKLPPTTTSNNKEGDSEENTNNCAFRSYPSNRLYGLFSKSPPNFLSDAAYIRGQWPIIINPNDNIEENNDSNIQQQQHNTISPPTKVCLDTTSWENSLSA